MEFNNINNNVTIYNLGDFPNQNTPQNDLTRFIPVTPIEDHPETLISTPNIKYQNDRLDLDNLYRTYTEEELFEQFISLFHGYDFFKNPNNFFAEFIIMQMYELLRELEFKTTVIDSKAISILNQSITQKRPIKNLIETCKSISIALLNLFRLLNYSLNHKEKESAQEKNIELINKGQKELIEFSKKLILYINSISCKCNSPLKKYIKLINIFSTINENHENKIKYVPWLYKPISQTPFSHLPNLYSSQSMLCGFDLMKKAKVFALQTGEEYLKSFVEISTTIKKSKESISKSLTKEDKLKLENLINHLEKYTSYLHQRSLNIKALDIFLETGKIGENIYNFLKENAEPFSGALDSKVVDKFNENSNIAQKEHEDAFPKLLDLSVPSTLEQSMINIINVLKSKKIHVKAKSQLIELTSILQKFDLYNVAGTRPYIQLIATMEIPPLSMITFREDSNKLSSKIKNEQIFTNYGNTVIYNIMDELKKISEIAPKKYFLCYDNNSEIKNSSSDSPFSYLEEHLGAITIFLSKEMGSNEMRHQFIVQKIIENLNLSIINTKNLVTIYNDDNKDIAFKILDLRKELVDLWKYFNTHTTGAYRFLLNRPNSLCLSEKEEKLKEKFFTDTVKELEDNNIKTQLKNQHNELFIDNEQIKLFINSILQILDKTTRNCVKLKNLLLKENNNTWKIEKNNFVKVKQLLTFLNYSKCMRGLKNNLMPICDELCNNQKELEYLQKFREFYTNYVFAFFKLSNNVLPLLQTWFDVEKIKIKKLFELEKKKTPEKKPFKGSTKTSKIKTASPSAKSNELKDDQQSVETTGLNDQNHIENQQNSSDEISSHSQDSEEEKSLENIPQKIKVKKSKILLNFKFVSYRKEKKSKPLPYWEELAMQIETVFDKFSFFRIVSEQEIFSHLLWRYHEFKKCEYNLQFNLAILRDVTLICHENIPETIHWVWSQSLPLITDCALRGMVTTKAACRKDDREFNLFTHDGRKLYKKLNLENSIDEIPSLVVGIDKHLNHSYVGSFPPSSIYQAGDEKKYFFDCFKLLNEEAKKQKKMDAKIFAKNHIENTKNITLNFLNTEKFFNLPERNAFSLKEFQLKREKLLMWVDKHLQKDEPVINAKKHIILALEQCRELIEFGEKIKATTPTLYGKMVAHLCNKLMSNVLHLFLAKDNLLNGEIDGRAVIHCHDPLKLWKLIVEKKLMDENPKIAKAMERFSADSRYPYRKMVSTEESLVKVYEIHTALTCSRKLENKSSRVSRLVEKNLKDGEEKLQSLMETFEAHLIKCFEVIEFLIEKY